MANLKLFLFSIFLIFSIMTSSISSEETETSTNSNTPTEGEGEMDVNPEDAHGNILDEEEGKTALKELGFENKESLTRVEMTSLVENLFLRLPKTEEEKRFYLDLIKNISKEIPENVKQSEIRNFFDLQYILKFIKEENGGQQKPSEDI